MFLIFGLSRVAIAEINIVDSLEWMTIDAPFIVRGKATGLEDIKGPGSVIYRDVTIAVEEIFKGQLADKTIKIRLRLFTGDKTALEWQYSGHCYLFFLRQGRAEDDKTLADQWVLRENRQSIINLDQPRRVYTAELKEARNAAAILNTVRTWATHKALHGFIGEPNIFKPQVGYLRLKIPWDTEFINEVCARSACYINVPVDEKYRPLAMTKAHSKEHNERANGAAMLRNFPGTETVKLLTTMLADPGEAKWMSGRDQLVNITYPVRQVAYEVLVALGEKPDKPLIERKLTKAEIRNVRDEYWKNSMRELLPKDWSVASIQSVKEPGGWTRIRGGDGIAIECRSSKLIVQDQVTGLHQPALMLYVMPMNWEGTSSKEDGEKIRDGNYSAPTSTLMERQINQTQYLGHEDPKSSGARKFFISINGHTGWYNPSEQLIRYFGLSINP
jgi:hypothetical protein